MESRPGKAEKALLGSFVDKRAFRTSTLGLRLIPSGGTLLLSF
jgi:hypothetical protein